MAEDAAAAPTLQEMIADHDRQDEGYEDPLAFETCMWKRQHVSHWGIEPMLTSQCGLVEAHNPTLHGLREISSLASWTVSTHKPTNGTHALLAPTPQTYWQSDGPQPHLLTVHFFKLVKIARLRVYLDFTLDESYTPTKMGFWAGWSSSYGLVQFAEWAGAEPRGWQEIPLDGCGVGGKAEIRCMVLQVRVLENHQNGKDTHIRGMQVFSTDERPSRRGLAVREDDGAVNGYVGAGPQSDDEERIIRRENLVVEPDSDGELELR